MCILIPGSANLEQYNFPFVYIDVYDDDERRNQFVDLEVVKSYIYQTKLTN